MVRLAVTVEGIRGYVSHFAHFICEFVIPLFSFLHDSRLLFVVEALEPLTIELSEQDEQMLMGGLQELAKQIFPTITFEYVARFSVAPIHIRSRLWVNDSDRVALFVKFLKTRFAVEKSPFGVLIIKRGRPANPTKCFGGRSGAGRRTISEGFDKLFRSVQRVRPDTLCVEFEKLTFREQLSLAMSADTLIGQHGAGFSHAHWMPRGGHLIELQPPEKIITPRFLESLSAIRGHRLDVVHFPCERVAGGGVGMRITNPRLVTRLVRPKRHSRR